MLNEIVVYLMVFLVLSAYIPLSYCLSWIFQDFINAVRFLMLILIFIYFLLALMLFLVIENGPLKWVITLAFPSISFYGGLVSNGKRQYDLLGQNVLMANPFYYALLLIL